VIAKTPAGADHGATVMHLAAPMAMHVRQCRLGEVLGAQTSFQVAYNPDTVRVPDVAFVRAERRRRNATPLRSEISTGCSNGGLALRT